MCLLRRHNHDTYLLIEGQFECVMYHSKYEFVIENDDTPYIIEKNIFLTYSEIVMSRDSDKQLETMKFEMNSLYITKYGLWLKHLGV